MRACIVVPHFDHLEQFRAYLPRLSQAGLPLVVVDDASPADTAEALADVLEREAPGALLVRHERNRGKGGAVMTGLKAAFDAGYTHALQIDADGQHDSAEIPAFLDAAEKFPNSLICGEPRFDESISKLRFYARYLTLCFAWLETLSTDIHDAMCGFRMYPLASVAPIIASARMGERMAFDPELLVRAIWAGIPLHFIPIRVVYPASGRSHFHYLRDNAEISWMHTRLLAGMLWRLPVLIRRKLPGAGGAV